jgi:hypothetical protein
MGAVDGFIAEHLVEVTSWDEVGDGNQTGELRLYLIR